ncbi:MAG: PDZ domain-containing protein [Methanocalculus sp. MSAO_Arc1]|uniref:site-2 protease family protein n=1 Tax=Methanocalculus TaxID=71151 RepID=UPI000FED92FD|nr:MULTISPECIES: site-2 protease family protein [unclassified Methanocalculus]MCP1662390.1 membrane-associated protease RseP (regulator of RpoE activity) [Methanocalculus sp. AMF5]RQD81366.1 MAG: PDZ domain-containing protein [Methanocalculus sp. MSAO_Arc1]
MEWYYPVLLAIGIYALAAAVIRRNGLFPENVSFFGPIMAIRTENVRFFDHFKSLSGFFRVYGTIGVLMVVFISGLMTYLLIRTTEITLLTQPEPTDFQKPQNILLIPGVNEFIPSSFAVWTALVLTIAIHEFGHGILCRIEGIAVKSTGLLLAVIPIGAFVEPDEEDLDRTHGMAKMRMFGAGIANNLTIGLACFIALVLLLGMVAPSPVPVVTGVYQDYPAWEADLPYPSIITMVDGTPVASRDEVTALLAGTAPGDSITLVVEKDNTLIERTLTLSEWPDELATGDEISSGFMGVSYYDSERVVMVFENLASPEGMLYLLIAPLNIVPGAEFLRVIPYETVESTYLQVPFDGFWPVIHLLFWLGWINIMVGIFNALPMLPLDGGHILREGLTRFLDKLGLVKYVDRIVVSVSWAVLFMLLSPLILPYLFHL